KHGGKVHTSCKKSATPFLSGHLKPMDSKNSRTSSRGPWYTTWPSERRMMSSNRLYVSGAGCSKEMTAVPLRMWMDCLSDGAIKPSRDLVHEKSPGWTNQHLTYRKHANDTIQNSENTSAKTIFLSWL
ncbi:hypothetical protein U9M48_018504, partial [Paspalum notatum var. saurae]